MDEMEDNDTEQLNSPGQVDSDSDTNQENVEAGLITPEGQTDSGCDTLKVELEAKVTTPEDQTDSGYDPFNVEMEAESTTPEGQNDSGCDPLNVEMVGEPTTPEGQTDSSCDPLNVEMEAEHITPEGQTDSACDPLKVVEAVLSTSKTQLDSDYKQKKKEFPCAHPGCNKKFGRPDRLKKHLLIHDNVRQYLCGIVSCGKSYTTAQHLRRHNETAHLKNENSNLFFTCDDLNCFKSFQSKQAMRKHFERTHQNARHTCDICFATFYYRAEYTKHMNDLHAVKTIMCDKCDLVFTSKNQKTRHMRGHRTYTCEAPECSGITFQRYVEKRKHDAIVHPIVYTCYHCNFQSQRKFFLEEHMYSKHLPPWERPLISCSHINCNSTFQHARNYLLHYKKKHLNEGTQFICPLGCPQTFATKQSCQRHVIKMHENKEGTPQKELPYSCNLCYKTFEKKHNVRRHVNRMHSQVSQRKSMAIEKLVPSAFIASRETSPS